MLERMWNKWISYTAVENVEWYSHSGRSLVVSFKAKHNLPYVLISTHLNIYYRGMKIYVHTKPWMPIYSIFPCNS